MILTKIEIEREASMARVDLAKTLPPDDVPLPGWTLVIAGDRVSVVVHSFKGYERSVAL